MFDDPSKNQTLLLGNIQIVLKVLFSSILVYWFRGLKQYYIPIRWLVCNLKYQSNRSLNIPSRAYLGHLMFFAAREGARGGAFRGWGIWSLRRADSKSWRRQALMHSKRKIPDSWRTGWKAKAYTSFTLYLKVFKNHLYYLRHVRVLSIKPYLHTQLPEHNRSYWKVSQG